MEVSSEKLKRMQKKIVLIHDKRSKCFIGHGVLISPSGFILTAFHLFESSSIGLKVDVKCHGEKGLKVEHIVGLDNLLDLALLQTETTNSKYARIAQEVQVGQDLHMIISSDGDIFSYTGGIVAFESRPRNAIARSERINFIAPETTFVQVHGLHGQPGCSGAPVFDSRGHVVGIYSNGYSRMDLLIHMTHLRKFSQPFIQEEEEEEKKKKKIKIKDIHVQSATSEAGEKKKRKKRN